MNFSSRSLPLLDNIVSFGKQKLIFSPLTRSEIHICSANKERAAVLPRDNSGVCISAADQRLGCVCVVAHEFVRSPGQIFRIVCSHPSRQQKEQKPASTSLLGSPPSPPPLAPWLSQARAAIRGACISWACVSGAAHRHVHFTGVHLRGHRI
jgi:hypothetical protein